jgi:predicted DNA-binding transcriptional regulator AlpA
MSERKEDVTISIGQVAERLGMTRQGADKVSKREGFPEPADRTRLGRFWRSSEVDAWISANRPARASTPEGGAT